MNFYDTKEKSINNKESIINQKESEMPMDYSDSSQQQAAEQNLIVTTGEYIPEHQRPLRIITDSGAGTSPHNPLRSLVSHIVDKTLFTLQLRLFTRIGGLEQFYNQLRDLAQSREPLAVRLLRLGELLLQQADIAPERYRVLLRYASELTRLSITLYQQATTSPYDPVHDSV